MLRFLSFLVLSLTVFLLACSGSEDESTPPETPQATPIQAETQAPAATPALTPVSTPAPTPMATPRPTPTATPAPHSSGDTHRSADLNGDARTNTATDGREGQTCPVLRAASLTPLFDPDAQPPVIDVSDEEEACLVAALGVDAVQATGICRDGH